MELNKDSLDAIGFIKTPSSFSFGNKSAIIFAPNGTGKTTLFKLLLSKYRDNVIPYTYDAASSDIFKEMIGKKSNKSFAISPYSVALSEKESERERLKSAIQVKTALKNSVGSSAQKDCKAVFGDDISGLLKGEVFESVVSLNDEQRKSLATAIENDDVPSLLKYYEDIRTLNEEETKINAELVSCIDQKVILGIFDVAKNKEFIEKNGCPMCGRNDANVYADILEMKKRVSSQQKTIFYEIPYIRSMDTEEAVSAEITKVSNCLRSLEPAQVATLLFTGGNPAKEEQLRKDVESYKEISGEIANLQDKREELYQLISNSSSYLKETFPRYYPGTSVEFDDKNKEVSIKTPRDVSSYSEGEKHEMYSIIMELAIIGSEKEIVLVDDPLTELDVANEYRNVFRFVNLARKCNKKVIVFTCNVDFINIAHSYDDKPFDKFYLDLGKRDDSDNLYLFDLLNMDLNQSHQPYLCLDNLLDGGDAVTIEDKVVKAINDRSHYELIGQKKGEYEKLSELLHYHGHHECKERGLSNDDLFDLIEKCIDAPFGKASSFKQLIKLKIAYLAALRVYIEKKLYEYDERRSELGCPKVLIGINETRKMIEVADSQQDYPIVNVYPHWSRQKLMLIKTMLNDVDHPYSKVLPCSFPMSVNSDTIFKEIMDVKNIFVTDQKKENQS